MNILHIIPNLKKGGAERLTIDIVRTFSQMDSINIQLILFEDKIEYDIKDIKELIHIIPSEVKLSPIRKNKFNIDQLQQFINKFNPDIIHTHLFKAELISRSCFFPSAKWVSHCHSNMHQFKKLSFKTILNKQYLTDFYEKKYLFKLYKKNRGTHFIAISKDTNIFFKKNAKQFKTTTLLNAISYDRFYKKSTISQKTIKPQLINVGSFQNKKNQRFLIKVADVLRLKKFAFKLILIGEGENKKFIENKIKKCGLDSHIKLNGNVDNVEHYLWQSDIYLHSATYEAFGLVLIEAMAAGLPVITLDGKGNRDLIEQDKNGYMIFENNPVLFANKIIDLWENKNDYQRISSYAQQYAKQFDIKMYCKDLLEMYKKI